MADFNELVKLAVDNYRGTVEKYSAEQTNETLRNALIELNGGSSKLDYRMIRDSKCSGIFSLIEEILSRTVVDGLMEDDLFMNLVDFRNVAAGDQNVFVLKDTTMFTVDKAADGTQAVRRQRIAGESEVVVPTIMHTVLIYEELNRILSGRVDFNHLIDVVSESFRQYILDEVYTLWCNATSTDLGGSEYIASGSYDESTLLTLIEHVEAAAGGKDAMILGTKKGLRALTPSISGDHPKNDLYDLGYYGKFYGSPVVAMPQRYKVGTKSFIFNDNVITVIATDQKPIKFVYEGDPIILPGEIGKNKDLTQEYFFGEKFGSAIVMASNEGIGRYTMS